MIYSERFAIFYLFLNYWNKLLRLEKDTLRLNYFYDKLRNIWLKNNWCILELIKIHHRIDERDELLNPNFFGGKELSYVEHVKSCVELKIF